MRDRIALWMLARVLRRLEEGDHYLVKTIRRRITRDREIRRIEQGCSQAATAVAKDILKEWKTKQGSRR